MRELHRRIFTGSAPRPALRVPGMTARVRAAIARRAPALAPAGAPPRSDPSLLMISRQCPASEPCSTSPPAPIAPTRLAPAILTRPRCLGLLLVALRATPTRAAEHGPDGSALARAGGALVADSTGARTLTLEGLDASSGDAVVKTMLDRVCLGGVRVSILGLTDAGS